MTQPSRRELLLTLSASGGAFLSGCVSGLGGANDTTTVPNCESTSSGSSPSEETASDACPPFDEGKREVCYGTVDSESVPVVLIPETQLLRPEESIEFTLRNQSDRELATNFYDWQLNKRVEGNWYRVAPKFTPQPLTPLPAGEEHTWTVTVTRGVVRSGKHIKHTSGTESLTIAGLGGGHYAFETDGYFDDDEDVERFGLAAGFELDAEPLALTQTNAIGETEWDGETLVAVSTRYESEESGPRDAFILERVDCSPPNPDARQFVVEQIVRNNQLRDTVALSQEYDADRVRLREFSRSTPVFGRMNSLTFEFQNRRYQVTTKDGDSL